MQNPAVLAIMIFMMKKYMVMEFSKSHFYTMNDISIKAGNLSKKFGNRRVIEACSFSIEKGTVFGLVGLNGAGKTTLIRILTGLLEPDAGDVSVDGFKPWLHSVDMYRRMGVVLEHDGFAGNMSIKENLRFFATARGLKWKDVVSYVEEFWSGTFIYNEVLNARNKVKYLSRGQKVQCGLCRAFLCWPPVYFFDEPSVALDIEAYDHFEKMVNDARKRACTVLISSHQMSTIEELCDTVGILDNGELHILADRDKQHGCRVWNIFADYREDFGKIMERITGASVSYSKSEGTWRLSLKEDESLMPQIITELAGAGCHIRQVSPEAFDIRDSIRRHCNADKCNL
jgi:ABC-2 type transport system ATP-binding protein